MYTNKLDNIVDKYNNLYHKTIRMKLVDVKSSSYIDFEIENNVKDKITNLKLAAAWEHQNIKTFLKNVTPHTGQKSRRFLKSWKCCVINICTKRPSQKKNIWNVLGKRIVKDKSKRVRS